MKPVILMITVALLMISVRLGKAEGDNLPSDGTTEGETPAGETPAGETPAGETPAGETPEGETPEGEPSASTPEGEPSASTPEGETPDSTPGEPTASTGVTADTNFTITLQGNYSVIADDDEGFIQSFIDQLSTLLGINSSFILVQDVRSGSVIVDFIIDDASAAKKAATELPAKIDNKEFVVSYKDYNFNATAISVPQTDLAEGTDAPVSVLVTPSSEILGLRKSDFIVIGIACGICLLLIIMGIIVCCRECTRRRRKKQYGFDDKSSYQIPRPQVSYNPTDDKVNIKGGAVNPAYINDVP